MDGPWILSWEVKLSLLFSAITTGGGGKGGTGKGGKGKGGGGKKGTKF